MWVFGGEREDLVLEVFFFFPFCNLVSFVFWQPKIPSVHSESL